MLRDCCKSDLCVVKDFRANCLLLSVLLLDGEIEVPFRGIDANELLSDITALQLT